jgi:hypothetical protein
MATSQWSAPYQARAGSGNGRRVDKARSRLLRVARQKKGAAVENATATGWDHFLHILTQPDNIPIVGLMILLFFFTYLALREARKNDQLIEQGREDEILERMQD